MRVDPKALVRRLTPTATRFLEAAVGRAATGQYYEILPEHLLAILVEPEDGDAAAFFAHFERDRSAFRDRVERALQRLRSGNAARPVFSRALFDWLQDAWLVASVERGATALRSLDLIAAFAAGEGRYSAESYPELDDLPESALRARLHELVEGPEARESGAPGEAAVGESKTTSGTGAIARFGISFTQLARDGKIDPVLGRHREIRQVIDILSRRRKNNPIIVGEPGVGKTALVEGLARAIVMGEVPEHMLEVEVVGLDLGALQAGAGVRGEFEGRLKSFLQEVKASPKPIVLFIDEAHTLIGAGGTQGTGDAANLLKPELARGELRTIAATTWSEYKKYFEKDAALERRFQPVKVEEPSEDEAIAILRGLRPVYEEAHGIAIRDEALIAAAKLSHRYISGRQLPDKAVDLLDSVAARARTELRAKPESIVALESRLATIEHALTAMARDVRDGFPVDAEAETALRAQKIELEAELAELDARHKRERVAVDRLLELRRMLASTEHEEQRQEHAKSLEEAMSELERVRGKDPLIHAEADAQAVARVVQSWTGIPVGKIQSDTMQAVLDLENRLRARIRGQEHAIQSVAEAVRMAHAGVANPDAPRAVMLFVGTSGVGKTETALALADTLYGGDRFLTTINMSEFQEKHTVSRLIGSPPGYVGYGQGGVLTEAVRRHPYSVVLLDECEKADLEVMNLFYQVFDKGALSDGEGRRIDFRNTVVVLTSNLATDVIARIYEANPTADVGAVLEAIRPTLSRHFKPALLARMTIVPFAPMGPETLREIVQLKLAGLARRLEQSHGAQTVFAPELLPELVSRCTVAETGARNVDHVLRGSLLPQLSRHILERVAEERPVRRIDVGLGEGGWSISLT